MPERERDGVRVYRFLIAAGTSEMSPTYVWGTRDAIARLGAATIEGSVREAGADRLENGFFYPGEE